MENVAVVKAQIADRVMVSEVEAGRWDVGMRCGHEVFWRCAACQNPPHEIRSSAETLTSIGTVFAGDSIAARTAAVEVLYRYGWRPGMSVSNAISKFLLESP